MLRSRFFFVVEARLNASECGFLLVSSLHVNSLPFSLSCSTSPSLSSYLLDRVRKRLVVLAEDGLGRGGGDHLGGGGRRRSGKGGDPATRNGTKGPPKSVRSAGRDGDADAATAAASAASQGRRRERGGLRGPARGWAGQVKEEREGEWKVSVNRTLCCVEKRKDRRTEHADRGKKQKVCSLKTRTRNRSLLSQLQAPIPDFSSPTRDADLSAIRAAFIKMQFGSQRPR